MVYLYVIYFLIVKKKKSPDIATCLLGAKLSRLRTTGLGSLTDVSF